MTVPVLDSLSGSTSALPKLSVKSPNHLSINQDGSSWFMTGIILTNILVGMGLLNIPEAYKESGGILNAITTQAVCVVFLVSGYVMITQCSDIYNKDTYQSVVQSLCGDWALVCCSITIFIHNFGTCITFLVLLADQLDELMVYIFGEDYCQFWYLTRKVTMPVCGLLFILPFCFVERIDGIMLKIISFIGVLSTSYVIFLVIVKYYTIKEPPRAAWSTPRWTDTLNAVPVICFSFEGHIEAVPLYSCLKKRTVHEFLKTVTFSMSLSLLVYTSVGIYGYLCTGNDVTSDILMSYYPADEIVIIGTGIVALKSITTYPGVFFCARLVTDDVSVLCCKRLSCDDKNRRIIEAVFFFILSVAIALLVPTIGSIIKLLGGSAAMFIMVFPGLCYIKAHMYGKDKIRYLKLLAGMIMVVTGTFMATAATVYSVQKYTSTEFNRKTKLCGLL